MELPPIPQPPIRFSLFLKFVNLILLYSLGGSSQGALSRRPREPLSTHSLALSAFSFLVYVHFCFALFSHFFLSATSLAMYQFDVYFVYILSSSLSLSHFSARLSPHTFFSPLYTILFIMLRLLVFCFPLILSFLFIFCFFPF